MEKQFEEFPATESFIALMAAYHLFGETIYKTLKDQPKERDGRLEELASLMGRIANRKNPRP